MTVMSLLTCFCIPKVNGFSSAQISSHTITIFFNNGNLWSVTFCVNMQPSGKPPITTTAAPSATFTTAGTTLTTTTSASTTPATTTGKLRALFCVCVHSAAICLCHRICLLSRCLSMLHTHRVPPSPSVGLSFSPCVYIKDFNQPSQGNSVNC